MKTIKLPYKADSKELIDKIQRQATSMFNLAYNRLHEGRSEKEIRFLSKSYNNIELLDSWLIQCSIRKAKALYEKDNEKNQKSIFGGKYNFRQRSYNLLTKEQYKEKRLHPICSQGEKLQKGNRKLKLCLENNQIIFKLNNKNHINLNLPKLHKKLRRELINIQTLCEQKQITLSCELTKDYIYLIYEQPKSNYKGSSRIVGSVDLNPNYIGFSICKFTNERQEILFKEVIDLSHFTQNLNLPNTHTKSKHQVNKQHFEIIKISKYIINKCRYYGVGKFIIEDLSFKNKDRGIKKLNRLCNNKWNRNLITQYLEKYCNLYGITFIKVNPAYSSFIGNLLYNEPDMVASSLELARRGYYKFVKNRFYPDLIDVESLRNRWKEASNWSYSNWKDLFRQIKTAKVKYRNSLEKYDFKVFRLNSDKSCIKLYSFI